MASIPKASHFSGLVFLYFSVIFSFFLTLYNLNVLRILRYSQISKALQMSCFFHCGFSTSSGTRQISLIKPLIIEYIYLSISVALYTFTVGDGSVFIKTTVDRIVHTVNTWSNFTYILTLHLWVFC